MADTDWREIALANQATMADLHKRRTASEHHQVMRELDRRRRITGAPKRMTRNQKQRYWQQRAITAELALARAQRSPAPRTAFYESREWKTLRYKALKLHGGKCQLCGSTGKLHVDHIKPRFKYPELELQLSNLQVLCADCNLGKGAWDQSDWRKGALKSIPGE